MTTKKSKAHYGTWKSAFSPAEIAKQIRLQDVQWDSSGETLVWLEERSDRGVLVVRDFTSAGQRDLTRKLSVRARIGYGGGDFLVKGGYAFFISDGAIYKQNLDQCQAYELLPRDGDVASPALSRDGRWLLFVRSRHGVDTLEVVSTTGDSPPTVLAEGSDFYMQPRWHPSGTSIAWIAWDHPNMPWNGSHLLVADLGTNRDQIRVISKLQVDTELTNAHFQPEFSPDGRFLSVVSDETGWTNLKVFSTENLEPQATIEEEAEHGLPAWIQGLRTYTWTPDSSAIYFLRSRNAFTALKRFDLADQSLSTVRGELSTYTALKQISISSTGDRIGLIGSASAIPPQVLSVTLEGGVEVVRHSGDSHLSGICSNAEPIRWNTGNDPCHGLYYAPKNPGYEDSGPPPVVIKIHGGPTSQYHAEYSIDTQFFTSRGYGVLALNYRGSTGYGRAYRNALTGSWGVTDVEDVRSAADFLTRKGLADRKRIILVGGSAGGYNLLMCFVRYPGVFRAGICRYGVSDLKSLAEDTHKFEAHYLDSLIGTLPEDEKIYRERSPIFYSDDIKDPLAIFQGDMDTVVPKSQSDLIVSSLEENQVPHLYQVYSGEGHGWRKLETIEDYYDTVDRFLRQYALS